MLETALGALERKSYKERGAGEEGGGEFIRKDGKNIPV